MCEIFVCDVAIIDRNTRGNVNSAEISEEQRSGSWFIFGAGGVAGSQAGL